MATVTGLTVIKKMTYRGDNNERYANTYWLSGAPPATPTDWRSLFDAMVAQEKLVYNNTVHVVGGYGYDSNADNATAVWSVDLTVSPNVVVDGSLGTTGGIVCPGDDAVWVRWGMDHFNSKGKRVYCRKYFHPAHIITGGGDAIATNQQTALNAFGAKLSDGTFVDGRLIRSRLNGALPVGHAASTYVTTRTLKRRGKRPTP